MVTAEFSKFAGILSGALSQHHLSGFEIAQLSSSIDEQLGYFHIFVIVNNAVVNIVVHISLLIHVFVNFR